MLINLLLLVLGFITLIKGADFFVTGSCGIADFFKISKMLIGLTIVSFGTSAPEFAVSVKSLLSNAGDIVLGNVIGSNITNILLILGICSLVHTLTVKNNTVKKELPITMLITTLFGVLLSDSLFDIKTNNSFTRSDGIILVLFFGVFIYYLISMSRKKIQDESISMLSIKKSIVFTSIGLLGIILGSNLVVDSAVIFAKIIGISERLISLTIIALGTSLPELVTSITATRKGEYDIAIGNVVGSNIFNIGAVLGISVSLFGGIGIINYSYIDLLVMITSAMILFMFSFNDYRISRKEGIIFLVLFLVYYSYVLLS